MADIDGLECPDLSALLRLAEKEEMNMRRFTTASQVSPVAARKALARLKKLGLVSVSGDERGATKVLAIELTPAGRDVAKHVAAIDAILRKRSK